MSTTQKPSEHAIRAALTHWIPVAAIFDEEATPETKCVIDLAKHIDEYAIAPAVAELQAEVARIKANIGCAREQSSTQYCAEVLERDKRIAELEEALRNMLGAHMEVSPNERWNCMEIAAIEATTVLTKKGQP